MSESAQIAIVEEELVWASPDGSDLLARVYRPEDALNQAAPVVVDVHGGIWSISARTTNAVYHRGLAARGVIVVAIDFRDGRSHRHPTASIDVTNAVRWARFRAPEWGGDPASIGMAITGTATPSLGFYIG
jgi:acetyl esterase